MKKIILAIAFLLVTVNAHALINLAYTGNFAERNDVIGYYPISYLGNQIGGPIANNTLGYAQQFYLLDPSYFSSIHFDMKIISQGGYEIPAGYSMPAEGMGGVDFKFKIYEGDAGYSNYLGGNAIRPDVSHLRYTSDPVVLKFNEVDFVTPGGTTYLKDTQYYYNQIKDINLELNPGTYWLAWERDDSSNIGIFTSKELVGHHAPEPATVLLMGVGLLGGAALRRKIA
jgi:hypothetical protein